jgi:hypothetical protein
LVDKVKNIEAIAKSKPNVTYQPKEGYLSIEYEGKVKKVSPKII